MNIEMVMNQKNKYINYIRTQLKVNKNDAEDIFGEAILKAWVHKDDILNLDRWMYTAVMFVGFNIKRVKIHKMTTTELLPENKSDVTPETLLACKTQCSILSDEIEKLPPQQQKAINLWYVQQLDVSDACVALKCGLNAAQTTRKLALKKLRKVVPEMEQYTVTKNWGIG